MCRRTRTRTIAPRLRTSPLNAREGEGVVPITDPSRVRVSFRETDVCRGEGEGPEFLRRHRGRSLRRVLGRGIVSLRRRSGSSGRVPRSSCGAGLGTNSGVERRVHPNRAPDSLYSGFPRSIPRNKERRSQTHF